MTALVSAIDEIELRVLGSSVPLTARVQIGPRRLLAADDFEEADGGTTLNFWQAQDRARVLASGGKNNDADDGKLISVKQALDRYEIDLEARAADTANVARVRLHLSEYLISKTVALLTSRDLRQWRDCLINKGLAPASINRSSAAFKAALNLAATLDERIVNKRAWEKGLATIPDAVEARNVVVAEGDILKIIDGAYQVGAEFGLLVEVDAVTGARPSQLGRLEVQDVQNNRDDPRLMMPSSRKGRGKKKILRHPVPIPRSLALRLRQMDGNRPPNGPLLRKPSGEAWKRADHTRLFARAVETRRARSDRNHDLRITPQQHSAAAAKSCANTRRCCEPRYQRCNDRKKLQPVHF